jgi:DNA-binding transcriptional LysR family regulator
VPGSVARAIRKRVPFSIVRQPFAPLTRRNFLVWHRSHDNDAAHRWLRERMVSYVHTAIAD